MTNEQREAIDRLEKLSEYGLCYTINEEIQEDIDTVLSLIKEQEKQIDLMARAFKQDDIRTVEEIKQYFKQKATNNG